MLNHMSQVEAQDKARIKNERVPKLNVPFFF